MAHTPTPWNYTKSLGGFNVRHTNPRNGRSDTVAVTESEDDARLLAAAPELLAALELLAFGDLDSIATHPDAKGAVNMATAMQRIAAAVIAKAGGAQL